MDAGFSTFVVHLTLGYTKKLEAFVSHQICRNLDTSRFKQECALIELPRKNLTHAISVSATL